MRKKKQMAKHRPTVMVILDGFGLTNAQRRGNAITPQTAPNIFRYMAEYPSTRLTAHGEAVGLFKNQEGNSEAGHFNIGAGRIVEQDLVRITHAIHDGTFFKNTAFDQALFHAQKYGTAVHLMGLLTDNQSAHARPEHLYALLEYFRKKNQKQVYLHLFTDGRDSPPHAAVMYLRNLRKMMKNGEKIATIMGRFYAMDRGKNWERTEAAYNAIVCPVGKSRIAQSAEEAITHAYNCGESDEYIAPTVIIENGEPVGRIADNDTIYFFNARSDRARQLTKAFVQKDFFKKNPGAFKRSCVPKNTRFVAMTDFGPDLGAVLSAFPSPDVPNCLAKAIGERYAQLYISETEKYAHVTYFINGGYPEPINGEDRLLVQSPHERSYAENPGMNAVEVTDTIIKKIKSGEYDFICVNYPNVDMVGHTGNFVAAKRAVTVVDTQLARIVEHLRKMGGQVIITADHGNAEEMINEVTGEMMTEHTTNPVPFIIISDTDKRLKLKKGGRLCDVAPTVLKLLDIQQPREMTGHSLL